MYDKWSRGIDMGQLIMPTSKKFARGGQFDVMVHFHGHEAARKEWITVMDGAVLVGIDLGLGSGPYETAFDAPEAFERLIRASSAPSRRRRASEAPRRARSGWAVERRLRRVQKILGSEVRQGAGRRGGAARWSALRLQRARALNGLQIQPSPTLRAKRRRVAS